MEDNIRSQSRLVNNAFFLKLLTELLLITSKYFIENSMISAKERGSYRSLNNIKLSSLSLL